MEDLMSQFIIQCVVFSVLSFSARASLADPQSVHGMAVVGNQKVYLSHLPMFHSPHNYQVILEVRLSPAAHSAYLKAKAGSNETLYTLVPQAFVLPEMTAHPQPFKADLYQGHFERGGAVIASGLTVTITQVLYFKKFVPGAQKPSQEKYILFGNTQEQFLAHEITARPDFDQLLSVVADAEGLEAGAKTEVKLSDVQVKQSLYLETGDLQ
jgi:hypothetical protein